MKPDLKVYGIFGFPLNHTVSPAIQNRAFDRHKLKSIYFAFERSPERFKFLMRNLRSLVLSGFNITVPYKETVIPYLNRLSPEARAVGAVNTVKKENARASGYNTDIHGFLTGLKEARFNPKGKSVLILGAGGSARAVIYGLAKNGAKKIVISNRTLSRAKTVKNKFSRLFPKTRIKAVPLTTKIKNILAGSDLLINTTKVGMKPADRLLFPKSFLPKRKILVYDLIYRPRETKLIKAAKRLGHRTINGETMLLHQGAKAFEIWTGKRAPIKEMKKALYDALRS